MSYKVVMLFVAIMLFVLMQPWFQPLAMSPVPDATVATLEETAIQACCPDPWPCFPGEAMCSK